MVFDEAADLVDTCLRIARFFRDESCGQCVPCRVGTVRQEEALHRLVQRRSLGSRADELALLEDVAHVMRDASICGLGQTAANAVQSAIARSACSAGGGRASRDDPRRQESRWPSTGAAPLEPRRLTIDGDGRAGARGRHDPRRLPREGVDTPTLCYADNLTPVNACRVCVVEVEGARTLVPGVQPPRPRTAWSSRPTPSACGTRARS